jgi:hypothetical protein
MRLAALALTSPAPELVLLDMRMPGTSEPTSQSYGRHPTLSP